MAIDIKELVIRAVVDSERMERRPATDDGRSRKEIVAECVEQVLDILRLKEER